MESHSPLVQTVQAFTKWRQQENKPSHIIPDKLRQQAVNLLEQYSAREITSALSVSGKQFKNWKQQFAKTTQQNAFIPLPMFEPIEPSISQSPSELELTLPSSSRLRIRGELSADLLRVLLQEAKAR